MKRVPKSRRILIGLVLFAHVALSACSSVPSQNSSRRGLFSYMGEGVPSRTLYSSQEDHSDDVVSSGASSSTAPLAGVIPSRASKKQAQALSFRWPVESVKLSSAYGPRDGDFHEGIDIKVDIGTPVFAAQSGKVIYTGTGISGYGKMIVLKHDHGFATVYAHNSKIVVKTGTRVSQGQRIALSGNTGRTSGPHLHFEVRRGVSALDPMRVLPALGKASRRYATLPKSDKIQ